MQSPTPLQEQATHGDHARPHPFRFLLWAWAGLSVLTTLSWVLLYAPFAGASILVALAIASVKVAIVALVFMELAGGHATPKTVAAVGVLFVVLLCLGVAADVAYR